MSNKKLTVEEKVTGIEEHFKDKNLDIDLIYYQIWKDKCVLSSTFYIPDTTLANDLKAMGYTIDEYNSYNPEQKIDISTKIFKNHLKAEYELISGFSATVDITSSYQIRYHTGKVGVDKVYYVIIKTKYK